MQLSKIYKRYTIATLTLVLLIGSLSHYLIITYFVRQSADHTLCEYRQTIGREVLTIDNKLPGNSRMELVPVAAALRLDEFFRDTLVYSHYKQETVVFRLLSYTQQRGQANFMVTLWQPTVDADDILLMVFVSLFMLLTLFVLFYFWLTKWSVGRLWRPFYQILTQLKQVDLINMHPIQTGVCRVDEFVTLNEVLNRMIDRIQGDYISLRELTETTSHELQTPLSVIKARLELLQQHADNSQAQTELIRSVSQAVDRVIRLNRFMLMIVKINNDQFPAGNQVLLNTFLDDFLTAYEDVIEMKSLTIHREYTTPLSLDLHPRMAEMLISNILSNAVRYNIPGGLIRIQTTATSLQVSNPFRNKIPAGDLFARFQRSSTELEAIGLGLSIVQSICQKNHLTVRADLRDGEFCLRVDSKA